MSTIKWSRQPDGSYTSEAGRIWRYEREGKKRDWQYEPNATTTGCYLASALASAKGSCEAVYRNHRFATMPTPPPREILQGVIARVGAKCLPDPVVLEALRACQHLVGLPPALADALTMQWREEQAAERRRLGL